MSFAFASRSGTRSITYTSEAPRNNAAYAAISPTGPAPNTAIDSPGRKPCNIFNVRGNVSLEDHSRRARHRAIPI